MSASGGTDWIDRLNDVSRVQDIDGALTRLLFLPIAAFFVQAANAVEAISDVVINPLGAFADGLVSLVEAILGDGAADVISAGAEATQADISIFGIASLPVSFLIVLGTAFILANYLQNDETSDLIPFSFTDIPFIGVQETPEED